MGSYIGPVHAPIEWDGKLVIFRRNGTEYLSSVPMYVLGAPDMLSMPSKLLLGSFAGL
jgi:hypothetical protein